MGLIMKQILQESKLDREEKGRASNRARCKGNRGSVSAPFFERKGFSYAVCKGDDKHV